ncbi:MAG TPA: hypothetical protein ENF65_01090, partial [Euryarchaeota archaeon]|nr:hypothetical protein [Euryarchaeota archaeon]
MATNKFLLLSAIGGSDLGRNGEDTPIMSPREANIYESSNEILSKIVCGMDDWRNYKAIILQPILDYVIESYRARKIDVLLFSTRQTPPNRKDTYPLGEIVKIILKERYRERGIEINVENSSISESPVDVASLYERFLNIISSKKEEEYDAVFVATTGGTPAMIRALTIASVVKFGGKVREVYKPVGSNVKEFDFPLRIHSKIGEDIVRTLWDLGMYFSALKLLKENTEVKLSRDEVSLLEAEANFYSFNFEKAKEIITKNGLTLSPNKKVRERSLELFEYIEG